MTWLNNDAISARLAALNLRCPHNLPSQTRTETGIMLDDGVFGANDFEYRFATPQAGELQPNTGRTLDAPEIDTRFGQVAQDTLEECDPPSYT